MSPVSASLLIASLLLTTAACSRRADRNPAALEKQFQESLSGVTLVGGSTRDNHAAISEEKYTIDKVSKLTGETWLFHTRIQYGSHDVSLPLPLTVKWAGDTPVITLTDLAIPGLGTYTARVMIYRGRYAGTWSGRNAGGQLFGKVVKQ